MDGVNGTVPRVLQTLLEVCFRLFVHTVPCLLYLFIWNKASFVEESQLLTSLESLPPSPLVHAERSPQHRYDHFHNDQTLRIHKMPSLTSVVFACFACLLSFLSASSELTSASIPHGDF